MGPAVVGVISGGSALVGGFLGALVPGAWRWVSDRTSQPVRPRRVRPSILDPDQAARVRSASQAWAEKHGRPEAASWAAGYLEDAALFVQRHKDGRR